MFHTKVRTKAAFAELGHDVFQTSQALRNRKKRSFKFQRHESWVKSTPRTNCWGKHKTYEHKELLPAFAVEGLLPCKQSSFGPLRHCFDWNHTSQSIKSPDSWFTFFHYVMLCYVMLHHVFNFTKTHPAFSLTAPPACPWPKLPLCDERNPWNWKLHEVPTNFGPGQWDFQSDLMATG